MRAFLAACFSIALALPVMAEVTIDAFKTEGGLTVWHVEENSIPFVALELRFKGGASLDTPEKRGAINLMTGLIEEGAGDLDAREFAKARDALAASFSYSVYDDTLTVSAKFLSENRAEALELLRQSLTSPRFDQDAIERVRAQVISGIRSDEKDPSSIAGQAFDARIYGSHPYGSDKSGSIETVSALTRDDLLAAFKATVAKDRLYIGVVGDISRDELGPILDALLAGIPDTGAPLPADATPAFDGETVIIPFETPQSVAMFGQPGVPFDHPDYFAAYLLNVVLGGGGFESRLMQEVREKRGLTYGVYSYLVDKDGADVWLGSVQSANNRVGEAMEVIKAEWARMQSEGVTETELEDAKRYLTGAYPLRFDGNGPIANILVGMQMQGMGTDYIATRNDRVNAVTLEQVNRVAREYLKPELLSFTVVGQPEGL
ncbi:M16 family metallopeptidase [Lentibacter sp. XHP0401]|uniref:M16 family metallopeptidase n=1 Tax=Lentibacter sp. XHP0401 TaxID=2984334 RepID=UPI0021E70538|nr:pitrilysin family protein [Lentibacter sp. XHP0401]MCV2894817.1 insulinase family protein [Lentibacter sp. XHP0401]